MVRSAVEEAVTAIGKIAVSRVPEGTGYIFDASAVRTVLTDLLHTVSETWNAGEAKPGAPDMVAAVKEHGPMTFCCPHCLSIAPAHGFAFAQFAIPGIGKGVVCTVFCGIPHCRRIISTQVLDFDAAIARPPKSRFEI